MDLSGWTDASIRTPCFCGNGGGEGRLYASGSVGNSGGALSSAAVESSSPLEEGEIGVVGADAPMSCERLYSIPFTFANSRSSTIAISRTGNGTVVVPFGLPVRGEV